MVDQTRQIGVCPLCGRAARAGAGNERCPSCGVAFVLPPGASADAHQNDTAATRAMVLPPEMVAVPHPAQPKPAVWSDPGDGATQPLPAGTFVPPDATLPLPPAPRLTPPAQADAPPPRRGWRRLISAVALIGVLLAVAALTTLTATGALHLPTASPSVRVTPTASVPPTAPRLTTFREGNGLYQVGIPADWPIASASGSTVNPTFFADPQNEASLNIQHLSAASASDPSLLAQRVIATLAGQPDHITNPLGPQMVTLAGSTWTEESADVVPQQSSTGHTLRVVVLAATHGDQLYLLTYSAPVVSFAATDARAFQPMLASFSFLL